MDLNLKSGGYDNTATDLMRSLNLRLGTSSAPTMLTTSEIALLRRDLVQTLDDAAAVKIKQAA